MSKAINDVIHERQRQQTEAGHTIQSDDRYQDFYLSWAAAAYAQNVADYGAMPNASEIWPNCTVPADWPWGVEYWKPKSPRQDLVRAAALIIADIERIDRAAGVVGESVDSGEETPETMAQAEKDTLVGLARIEVKRWQNCADQQRGRFMVELMRVAIASLTSTDERQEGEL